MTSAELFQKRPFDDDDDDGSKKVKSDSQSHSDTMSGRCSVFGDSESLKQA